MLQLPGTACQLRQICMPRQSGLKGVYVGTLHSLKPHLLDCHLPVLWPLKGIGASNTNSAKVHFESGTMRWRLGT